jgi:PIN domain nuclease of toxin-antitoxin system
MRLLLDTHVLLWWVMDDERLPAGLDPLLNDPDTEAFVSAASAWEIAIKARLRKVEPGPLGQGFAAAVERQGFLPLPITLEHAERAGALPPHHSDPFDRMLVAQAHAENLHLVSGDGVLDHYGVVRVW